MKRAILIFNRLHFYDITEDIPAVLKQWGSGSEGDAIHALMDEFNCDRWVEGESIYEAVDLMIGIQSLLIETEEDKRDIKKCPKCKSTEIHTEVLLSRFGYVNVNNFEIWEIPDDLEFEAVDVKTADEFICMKCHHEWEE